jgi:SAM-dependent methyltransferase
VLRQSDLYCEQCNRTFPIINGVPIMLPEANQANIQHEQDLVVRTGYNPWIERMIMQSLTDAQVVVDAGSGNMQLDDPCIIRMDVKLTPYVDVVGDLHALPFKPASIDFIFALAVVEHLHNPFVAAEQMYTALKPGGYVYAECNFVFPYHGYPDHYFNASIHGLRQVFSRFRELRLGVAPYQMPSFALVSVLNTYLALFKPSSLMEHWFVFFVRALQEFPLRYYDSKFTPETDYRVAAGDYFVGIKQPTGKESLVPAPIQTIYEQNPELQRRYPDSVDLATPDNLMTWAKTEGARLHAEIAACLGGTRAFSKYAASPVAPERKITLDTRMLPPERQRYIREESRPLSLWNVFRTLFLSPFEVLITRAMLASARRGRQIIRGRIRR